jgi:UDP-2-acetamido-3-amino-2,3-dideoxy-glucuronate N-acetyltransferase
MSISKHPTALIGKGAVIGNGTRVWAFVNIMDGATVGEDCNICDHCFVETGAMIGHGVTIKNNVPVYAGITLEDGVFVGPNATFVNDRHPRSRNTNWKCERTLIRRGASIGANATIMCGVTVGVSALVGAGAVVLRDVPDFMAVAGNPAKIIGRVDAQGCLVSREEKT